MINCVIIDKDKADRKIIEGIINEVKHLQVLSSCEKLHEVKDSLTNGEIDILFLNMPTYIQDRKDLLHGATHERTNIIVVSNDRDTANEAYNLNAVDFILKPVTASRLIKGVNKALNIKKPFERHISQERNSIFIRVNKHFVKIALKDIFLIEALADYVNLYTESKRYTIHATMKAMEMKLPKKDFIRVHKSYIVRLDHIDEINKETLSIQERTVRISTTYKKALMERLKVI